MPATQQQVDDHIEVALGSVRKIYQEAAAVIQSLKSGEKIPATKLAAEVAKNYGMSGPQLYPTILFLLKDYPGVKQKRGVQGGIWML